MKFLAFNKGKPYPKKNQDGESPKPFLRTTNVLWGYLNLNKVDRMDFNDKEVKRLALKPNDLLICEGGDIGRTAIWNGEIDPCFYQNHIHRLRLIRTDVEPQFVMFWMQAAIKLLGLYEGEGNKTTIPNLSKARLSKFLVPLPPPHEQRAIAYVLLVVQAAREARVRELALERERKAALMEHLFTHGTRGEPTKMTEIGEMPESWKIMELGGACEFLQYGTSKHCNDDYSGIPVLRIPNVVDGNINIKKLKFVRLPSKEIDNLRLEPGDLLFVRTNGRKEYLGRCAVFDGELEKSIFASYLIRIRLNNKLFLSKFVNIYSMTNIGRSFLSGQASNAADGKFNINTQTIRKVLIPKPSPEEQHEISHTIDACDARIAALDNEARLHDELFRAMLEEMMTGRIQTGRWLRLRDLPKRQREKYG